MGVDLTIQFRGSDGATPLLECAPFIRRSDEQAETAMRACGETDEESMEATIQLLEAFIRHSDRLEFQKRITDRASARMQVIAERLVGRDVMEETYRH